MTNLERLKEYASEFPKEVEQECLIQIKKMRQKGFSYEWISEAITHKKQEEWIKWGFGLLHSDNYQRQITNLINKKKEQNNEVDITNLNWDSLEDENNQPKSYSKEYKTEKSEINNLFMNRSSEQLLEKLKKKVM